MAKAAVFPDPVGAQANISRPYSEIIKEFFAHAYVHNKLPPLIKEQFAFEWASVYRIPFSPNSSSHKVER